MNRKEYIYYSFMKKVVEDEYISLEESGLVLILEERLALSDDRMDEITGMIQEGEEPEPSEMMKLASDDSDHLLEKDIYEHVLREAAEDEDIHEDELGALEYLARIMNITEEERKEIYSEVKEEPGLMRRMGKALRLE